MRSGRVISRAPRVVGAGPVIPSLRTVDPVGVPVAAGRTWVLVALCTDRRRGDRVRPLAAFRGPTVRRPHDSVKGWKRSGSHTGG